LPLPQCFGKNPDAVFNRTASGEHDFIQSQRKSSFIDVQRGYISDHVLEQTLHAFKIGTDPPAAFFIRLFPE